MTRPEISASDRQTALFWLVGLLLVQMLCQIALLVPSLGGFRVIFRTAAFAAALVALVFVPGTSTKTPFRGWLIASVSLVGLMIFHPTTNTPLVALAQTALYLAILSPVIWVSRLRLDAAAFAGLISFLWFFHTVSASLGVLQSLYPGRFDTPISEVLLNAGNVEGLKIKLADGTEIYRPSGLTDAPGGASSAGLIAYLFGMGFLSTSPRWSVRLLSMIAIGVGLYCIYLCQVRVNLILALISTLIFSLGLFLLNRQAQFWRLMATLPIIITLSTVAAFSIGGSSTIERLQTLIEDDPQKVYGRNRGQFLEQTFTELLPDYPFGAGLGRWGMTRNYFGDEGNPNSPPIWVEIQFTGWVLDGGLLLLILYTGAVVIAIGSTLRTALQTRNPWLSTWGLLVVGYDVSILAAMFSYVPFIGQIGLEFWLFNTAYYVTARHEARA